MEKRPPRRRSQTPLGSGKEKEKGSLLGCQATPAHGLQISDSQGNQKCTLSFEAAKLVTVCSESTGKLMFLLYAEAGPQLIGIHTLAWDPIMVSSEDRKMEAHQHRATVRATTDSAPGIPRASTPPPRQDSPMGISPLPTQSTVSMPIRPEFLGILEH